MLDVRLSWRGITSILDSMPGVRLSRKDWKDLQSFQSFPLSRLALVLQLAVHKYRCVIFTSTVSVSVFGLGTGRTSEVLTSSNMARRAVIVQDFPLRTHIHPLQRPLPLHLQHWGMLIHVVSCLAAASYVIMLYCLV